MLDIILDLETMSVGPKAAITAIGAVEFDRNSGTIGTTFYTPVDLTSSVRAGGEMDPETVLWWMQQDDAARLEFAGGGADLTKALNDFSAWLRTCGSKNTVRVWGNGADFDNVILDAAYHSVGLERPWYRHNDRCYRDVKNRHPELRIQRTGTHHNALDDAVSQAEHLIALLAAGVPTAAPA